jgi:hypothetical protein
MSRRPRWLFEKSVVAVGTSRPQARLGEAVQVDMSLSHAEAVKVLQLLDKDHRASGNPMSKSAAKKVWRHLVDAGVLEDPDKEVE